MTWQGFSRTQLIGRSILALLLPFSVACSSEPDPIGREAQCLRELTVPPAARTLDVSGVERIDHTIRVSWELETDWNWEQYATWVKKRLEEQDRFTPNPGGPLSFSFVKQLPGDTHAIQIELVKPGPPALIRVVFRSWAS